MTVKNEHGTTFFQSGRQQGKTLFIKEYLHWFPERQSPKDITAQVNEASKPVMLPEIKAKMITLHDDDSITTELIDQGDRV